MNHIQQPLSIPEQPELTLGAHVWDCAVPLAYQLNANFDQFKPSSTNKRLDIIELGAGCGIVGLVASASAAQLDVKATTYITDIEQVVESVTVPLLDRSRKQFPSLSSLSIHAQVLDWTQPKLPQKEEGSAGLLVLATDVLYNVGSHDAFLKCLLHLFDQPRWHSKVAWIGYKPRASGDDAWFTLARESGLTVARCALMEGHVQDVQLYKVSRSDSKLATKVK